MVYNVQTATVQKPAYLINIFYCIVTFSYCSIKTTSLQRHNAIVQLCLVSKFHTNRLHFVDSQVSHSFVNKQYVTSKCLTSHTYYFTDNIYTKIKAFSPHHIMFSDHWVLECTNRWYEHNAKKMSIMLIGLISTCQCLNAWLHDFFPHHCEIPQFLHAKAATDLVHLSHPQFRLSVTWVDQSKTVEDRITKSSPSASWKTIVL